METEIQSVLSAICQRSFPDFAPANTTAPYITWQQIGGGVTNYTDDSVPSSRMARIQINAWAVTRIEANQMALQIEEAMILAAGIQARPKGAFIATTDEDMNLRGAMQDFSVSANR